MEAQMKKEYALAVRKAKAQSRSGSAKDASDAGVKTTKKRKTDEVEDECSKRTKISMIVGGISIKIEQDRQQNSKKKQAASKASKETSAKGGKAVGSSPQKSSSKATAKAAKETKDAAGKADSESPSKQKAKPASTTAICSPSKQAAEKPKATPKQKAEPKVKT